MANGKFFESKVEEAEERLRDGGWRNPDPGDMLLVGFKYLGDKLDENTLTIKIQGKVWFPAGMVTGGIILGIVQRFLFTPLV